MPFTTKRVDVAMDNYWINKHARDNLDDELDKRLEKYLRYPIKAVHVEFISFQSLWLQISAG